MTKVLTHMPILRDYVIPWFPPRMSHAESRLKIVLFLYKIRINLLL